MISKKVDQSVFQWVRRKKAHVIFEEKKNKSNRRENTEVKKMPFVMPSPRKREVGGGALCQPALRPS
jgi:hypothetical protein